MSMIVSYFLSQLAVDSQILELVKPEPGAVEDARKKLATVWSKMKAISTYLTMR